MKKLHPLTVQLTEDMIEMIEESVEDGPYVDASELMREALRDWMTQQAREMGISDDLMDMMAGDNAMVDLSQRFNQLLESPAKVKGRKNK